MVLRGSVVALVTPMLSSGEIDFSAFDALVDWHLEQKTDGLVIAGTTGESVTLSFEEYQLLLKRAVARVDRRVPVIAGAGACATQDAIALSTIAQKLGADGILSVTPYYNKPSQEGLFKHFVAIAQAVHLPIFLYNVPGRTACDMTNDTVVRLAQVENIVGIKDATGDLARAVDLLQRVPSHFQVLSGDDATALAYMLLGAQGVISVTANVAPNAMHQLCRLALDMQCGPARELNQRLHVLHTKLFLEANPIPVKWALNRLGKIQDGIRLPLTPLAEQYVTILEVALRDALVLA